MTVVSDQGMTKNFKKGGKRSVMTDTAVAGQAVTGRAEDEPGDTPDASAQSSTHRAGEPRIVRIGQQISSLPAWLQVLTIYAVSRLVDFLIIGRVARFQAPSVWSKPDSGYSGILSLWDGDWYRRVAETGYPSTLPVDATGAVQQNEWAFYPLFPTTVRTVMRVLGTEWALTASFVAMLCGALAVLVMYSLVQRTAGRSAALWTVALFSFFPSAAVLQLAYSEAMGVLLLVTTLWCLQRREYLPGVAVVLMTGLARPIGVPIAAVVGLHVLLRIIHRRREPVSPGTLLAMLALTGSAAFSAVEWPLIAARATGVPDAYTQSMSAWRAGHEIVPIKPWWWMSRYFLGEWAGPATLAVVVILTVWALTRPAARAIAGDLRTWVFCYLGYLVVVLDPSTSLPRYLLLLFPIGTVAAAASPSPAYRRALLVAFAAGQILWVSWLWRFSPPTDWPP
jgi:hypothetical protein